MSQDIALIYNPSSAGGRSHRQRKRVEALFRAYGVSYDLFVTESETHLVETAGWAAKEYPILVGAGGDTTFNLIANEIIRHQQKNALGIIGLGSVNDVARQFGVLTLQDACAAIHQRNIRKVDVGLISAKGLEKPHYFLGTAGLGLGVEVTRYVERWLERHRFVSRFRSVAQPFAGFLAVRDAFREGRVPITLELHDEGSSQKIISPYVIFNNTAFTAGGFAPSPSANPYDGKLDCTVFYTQTFGRFFRATMRLKSGKSLTKKEVETIQGKKFSVRSSDTIRLQVDGDIIKAKGAVQVSLLPGALNVLVGPNT